jgi:hypothetical protein
VDKKQWNGSTVKYEYLLFEPKQKKQKVCIIDLFSDEDRWPTKAFLHKLLGEGQRENQPEFKKKKVRLVQSAC